MKIQFHNKIDSLLNYVSNQLSRYGFVAKVIAPCQIEYNITALKCLQNHLHNINFSSVSLFGTWLTWSQFSFDAILFFKQLHFSHTFGQGIISGNCQVFGVLFCWRWPRWFSQCKRFFDLRNLWKCGSMATSWQRYTYFSGLNFNGWWWRLSRFIIIIQIRRWRPWNWSSFPRCYREILKI